MAKSFLIFIFSVIVLLISAGYFSGINGSYHLAFPWNFPLKVHEPVFFHLAWPWNFPIGVLTTFIIGYVIGRKKT